MSTLDLPGVGSAHVNRTDTELFAHPWEVPIFRLWLTYRSKPTGHLWRLWFRRPEDRDRFIAVFERAGYQDFTSGIR